MVTTTRFAPSPTGNLHLGHALAARVAHDFAKRHGGGRFLLRHEDIDGTRVREEYYGGIEEDLRWLGLQWDGVVVRQTDRVAAYEAALGHLQEGGDVYPCFCTRKEIQAEVMGMVAAPQGEMGVRYSGKCRSMSRGEAQERMDSGQRFAWRWNAERVKSRVGRLTFEDLRYGKVVVDAERLGDVVLARKDIGCSYHLAVVVDDAWQEVTHVTRGEDLLEATHVHRALQCLLGLEEPKYLHHELVVDEFGKRLAKRCDAKAISVMRAQGVGVDEIWRMVAAHVPECCR